MGFNNFITESRLEQIIEEEYKKFQKERILSRAKAWLKRAAPHRKDIDDFFTGKGSQFVDLDGKVNYEKISKWYQKQTSTVPVDEKKKRKKKRKGGKRDGKGASSKGYSLRDWFKGGGWVQTGGKYDGKPCAKQPGQKTKPYCRDPDDRAKLSKKDRDKRARKKRKEDPNPERRGKAKNVSQKKRGKKK